MLLKEAQVLAVAKCYDLQPDCQRVNIVGSVRRKVEWVNDIEIICTPKYVASGQIDLFTNETPPEEISPTFWDTVLGLGKLVKGKKGGRYLRFLLPEASLPNFHLDLYIPRPEDYYRMYAIRTGPAEYAQKEFAWKWRLLGWCGTPEGLRRMEDCVLKKGAAPGEKQSWAVARDGAKPPVWGSEAEFYDWLKLPYLKPEFRK